MKNFLRYLKHVALTALVITIGAVTFLLMSGNKLKYDPNYALNELLDKEGPFIISDHDSVVVSYIHGDYKRGFSVERKVVRDSIIGLSVYYPPDSTSFPIMVPPYKTIPSPANSYQTDQQILVISDIEGNYKTFRDFLIANGVVDTKLNWTFDKGHLVLLGDFVDRGYFVTQVLYLIYKLEQDASLAGGKVHFILGNHEIMNMQGDHGYASDKYVVAAAALDLKPDQLYDPNVTFLARWLASKNTMERINDILFTHGGLHPDFARYNGTLDELNQIIRKSYHRPYYPKANSNNEKDELLRSSDKCPYWYRGYFNDDLDLATIDSTLKTFNARQIVVGHTIQSHVNIAHEGRVIAVDVEHPQERWRASFPAMHAEGLLIKQGEYYRLLDTGEQEPLR